MRVGRGAMLPGGRRRRFHGGMPSPVPLLHVIRGGRVESVHSGSYVLVQDGLVVEDAGNPDRRAYFRSTAKPFQAMGCVLSGAADAFGFTPAMLALAAGSHNGEARHVALARQMLAKAGVEEDALGCGGHLSIVPKVRVEQIRVLPEGAEAPSAVYSNCSGKHASMLASAAHLGAPLGTYLDPAHPVQQTITEVIAACAGVALDDIGIGIDGCGAPVHEITIAQMAHAMHRLGCPDELPGPMADAARRVAAAMHAHPGMVAGLERFDTDLMEMAGAVLLAKAGAEGVHGVAVPALKLGLAIKIEDGSDRGYRQVVIELLRRHGALTAAEADALSERHGRTMKNFAGTEVGHLAVVI